jgi:hypothetical protein
MRLHPFSLTLPIAGPLVAAYVIRWRAPYTRRSTYHQQRLSSTSSLHLFAKMSQIFDFSKVPRCVVTRRYVRGSKETMSIPNLERASVMTKS